MDEGELSEMVQKIQGQVNTCRLEEAQQIVLLHSDVENLKARVDKLEGSLYGPNGLMSSITLMVEHFSRLDKSLSKAIEILIPSDGTPGLLTRLQLVEKVLEETKDWKKWFFRTLVGTILTALIGILVAIFH